jgi:hypothetical protein
MALMSAGAMPASQIVNPTIDVAAQFQQGRLDTAQNTANDMANQASQLELLATGAAYAMPQGPAGPVDPARWNEVLDTYEASGMPADKVKAFRDNPNMAGVLLRGSTRALKAAQDEQAFPLELQKLEAEIALAMSGTQKNLAGPTPTDDQRELAQINAEREAAGTKPLSMEEYQAAKKSNTGFSVTTNPDGTVSVVQGAKPLTEGQSKDMVFVTRAAGALPIVDSLGEKLTSLTEKVGGDVPLIGNYLKSEEYQQAEQAGREFLAAILRKDTGAAVTDGELATYGATYLPQPGDKPANLAQKKAARARAVKAIEMGLPPQAILSLEGEGVDVPEMPGGEGEPEAVGMPQVGDVQDGYEYVGGDPADEKSWKKVN